MAARMLPAFLARLFTRFRRIPPRPGPYKLDDPEQDGPAWVPAPPLPGWRIEFALTSREQYTSLFEAMIAKPPVEIAVHDCLGGYFPALVHRVWFAGVTVPEASVCEVFQAGPPIGRFWPANHAVVIAVPERLHPAPSGRAITFNARILRCTTPTGVEVTYA